MKKKFTFLMAALFALMLITLPGMVKGQTITINFENHAIPTGWTNTNEMAVVSNPVQTDATGDYCLSTNGKASNSLTSGYIENIVSISVDATRTSNNSTNEVYIDFCPNTSFGNSDTQSQSVTVNKNSWSTSTLTLSNTANGYVRIRRSGGTSTATKYIDNIVITCSSGGSSVTAPTLTAAANFDANMDVTITPASETTVYYTIDGTTPSNSHGTSITAAATINIKATTTVKAIAYDGDNHASSEVSRTYTKTTQNISDITATGSYTVVGTIVAAHSKGFVFGDGTGYTYYYKNNTTGTIGNIVKFSNKTISTYGNVFEFNDQAYSGNQPKSNYDSSTATATIITGSDISDYTSGNHLSDYVEIEGTLSTYNFSIENYSSGGMISYPTNAPKELLDPLNGHKVRIKGYFTGMSNSKFTLMLESVEDINPVVTTSVTELTGFTYNYNNGPSAAQSFTVSGSHLTANVDVTANDNYLVCLTENGEYTSSVSVPQTSGTITNATVYVKLRSGLNSGIYNSENDKLTLTSTGATSKTITLSGTVTHAITKGSPSNGTLAVATAAYNGETVTITATPNSGYKLDSWSITKTDDGTSAGVTPTISSGNDYTITMPDFAIIVNATFVSAYDITVTNSTPAGGSVTTTPTSAREGETITITVSPNSGYVLNSMVVKDAGDNTITVTNNQFTMPASNVTITVSFIATYTVTYNANTDTGLSGDVPVDNNSPYTSGSTVTVLGPNTLTKTGYTFNGWNTEAGGSGSAYTAGGEFTITANITLYAQWTINEYAYTLDITGDDDDAMAALEVDDEEIGINDEIEYGKEVTVTVVTTDGYTYSVSVKDAENNDIAVTDDTFIMPANSVVVTVTTRQLCKYVLVTSDEQLVAGKHYVIASGTSGTAYAMGYQNTNNRPQSAAVTFSSGKIVEAGDIWDFVLSGDATNGWTLYDKYTDGEGFLYAASSSNNNLKLQTTLDSNGKWDISFANNIASIVAKGSYTHKYMRYNSGSSLFSCYESGKQSDIYLYVKEDDTDYEIYSETPMSGLQTITSLVVEDKLTIQNGAILTVTGTIDNDNPANLIIEDGGQLIVNNSGVQATVKKALPAAASKATNWTTIASPVKNISIGDTDEAGNVTHLKDVDYALYRFNETTPEWENYKNGAYHDGEDGDDFEIFEAGRGYLYSRTSLTTLEYVGEVNGDAYTEYTLTMSGNKTSGFHLIGNPYSHDIYKGAKGKGCAISNTSDDDTYVLATGFYQLKNGTSWLPKLDDGTKIEKGEGILVQATTAGTLRIYNSATAPAKANTINHDNIMFTVANGQNEDAAYALFDKGMGLSKINHRDNVTPMIYIEQKGEDYAIATMSDDTKSFNLNFKAMTTGQYTLSYKANGDFNYLHVIDRLTGEDVDMLLEGEYKFIGTPSDKDNRFIVKLGYMPDYSDADNEIFAYQSGSDILVSGTGELQIFDVTGRQVMTTTINGAESISVPAQGVYIFRLVGNEIKTQKIVVR